MPPLASEHEEPGFSSTDADQGCEPDVEQLYRTHQAPLRRFFARRTGSRDEANDLVQEAFSRLSGVQKGTRLSSPEAYLNRISRNLLHNRAKTRIRRSAHLHVVAEGELPASGDQERLLESRDMLRRLEAAMLKLKPKTREIFMAHRLDGMSYAEIAERTGLSIKGVEKQMSKAIAHLDRMFGRP